MNSRRLMALLAPRTTSGRKQKYHIFGPRNGATWFTA